METKHTAGNWKYTANTHNKLSPFFIQSGPHIIADVMITLQNNHIPKPRRRGY